MSEGSLVSFTKAQVFQFLVKGTGICYLTVVPARSCPSLEFQLLRMAKREMGVLIEGDEWLRRRELGG
jgi:hypothetical protein